MTESMGMGRSVCFVTPYARAMTDWDELTQRTLEGLKQCDDLYRPTNFWGPGLEQLLDDMRNQGLENFKSWSSAGFWFYPRYGLGMDSEQLQAAVDAVREIHPAASPGAVRQGLSGGVDARRDFAAARLSWDHRRWPIMLGRYGESRHGRPPQLFSLTGQRRGWTRPYLNYMLCMTALSHHVERAPTSVLELGGGFGVLGEFLMSRSEEVRYVDVDIPPLLTVSSYYLRTLFGDRVAIPGDVPETGPITVERSAVLPNWRIGDIVGPFDLFINAYSFQEMEPHVVDNYIEQVVGRDVEFVVSLNSRNGKPKLSDGAAIGVADPVTSQFIVDGFESRGYTLLKRYGAPLIESAGELTVLRRTDRIPPAAETPGRSGRWGRGPRTP